jgi:hypothetical protein
MESDLVLHQTNSKFFRSENELKHIGRYIHVVVVWEFFNGLGSEPANFNRPVKKIINQRNPAKASQSNFLSDWTDLSYLHRSTGSEHNSYRAEWPQNSLQKRLHQLDSPIILIIYHPSIHIPCFLGDGRGFGIFFFFVCVCVCVCIGEGPTMGALPDLRSSRPLGRGRLKIWKAPLAHNLPLCEVIVFFFFFFFWID